jgi:hypothetical protein
MAQPSTSLTSLELFTKATAHVNKTYLVGMIAWVKAERPDLERQLIAAENTVNKLWDGDSKDFKAALNEYVKLLLTAIDAFKTSMTAKSVE